MGPGAAAAATMSDSEAEEAERLQRDAMDGEDRDEDDGMYDSISKYSLYMPVRIQYSISRSLILLIFLAECNTIVVSCHIWPTRNIEIVRRSYIVLSNDMYAVICELICMLLFVSHDFVRLALPAWHSKWPQLAPTAALNDLHASSSMSSISDS